MDEIDFTTWTDAQLAAALPLRSAYHVTLKAEVQRRLDTGQSDDGSQARVDELIKTNAQWVSSGAIQRGEWS